ncbi:hypothetical protein BZA77DRAFT_317390 [Pyronema omphalodes]|nr:hypothetical protein BZA77DRAFT_317390 [Pyronema omphalodes]
MSIIPASCLFSIFFLPSCLLAFLPSRLLAFSLFYSILHYFFFSFFFSYCFVPLFFLIPLSSFLCLCLHNAATILTFMTLFFLSSYLRLYSLIFGCIPFSFLSSFSFERGY